MRVWVIVLAACGLAACSSNFEVSKLSPSDRVTGVPFRVAVPYLAKGMLMEHTSKKVETCTPTPFTKVIMLPGPDLYQVRFDPSALGKGEFDVELTPDGTLKKVSVNSDSRAAENLKALTDTLTGVLQAAKISSGARTPSPKAPPCNSGEVIQDIEPFHG